MENLAEVFAPGEFLKEEMEARGWSQVELAEVLGRPAKLVNEIIAGKKAITPETAVQLGDALGTGPAIWMNLEAQYQLSKVTTRSDVVARRAALYDRFPVRDMIKRGWVGASENIDVLEQQFLSFFGIKSLEDKATFAHAAKKSEPMSEITMPQLAWLLRARVIASQMISKKFDVKKLRNSMEKLSALRTAPEETRHVAKILADAGVRFVLIEALPNSKIDGACFWLDDQPVVAMSLRLDRIDNFWFVLRHELEHVLQGHGKAQQFILDVDIEGMDASHIVEEERMANDAAANFCVDQDELTNFIGRVAPYFSEERVLGFARRLDIHTGIVAGQLRRRLGRWDRWTQHLVKVKDIVIKSTAVDGWGLVVEST